jgi:hypothetical protein
MRIVIAMIATANKPQSMILMTVRLLEQSALMRLSSSKSVFGSLPKHGTFSR